jgi:hypothetical protein
VGDVLGFMIDPTVEGGPTAEQRGQLWGKELSLPDVAGDVVTLDPPYDAYECEGPQYLCLSGTDQLPDTGWQEIGFVETVEPRIASRHGIAIPDRYKPAADVVPDGRSKAGW